MGTPNYNLQIAVGGTTPGALNNTTAGSYPYMNNSNLTIIDNLYGPNTPVPTSGININNNLSFNGYSLTDALNGTFTGTLTVGTLAVSNFSVATLLTNTIENLASNSGIAIDPSPTSTGVALVVNTQNALTAGGKIIEFQNHSSIIGFMDYAGNLSLGQNTNGFANVAPYLYFNAGNGSTAYQSSIQGIAAGGMGFNVPSSSSYQWNIGGTDTLALLGGTLQLQNVSVIRQYGSSSSVTLQGNAAASGTGVILDNTTQATSGNSTISFKSGGNQLASFDYQGNLNLGVPGQTASLAPTLYLNAGNGSTAYQSSIEALTNGNLDLITSGAFGFTIQGTEAVGITSTQLQLYNIPLVQSFPTTALTLVGNSGASGPGVVMNTGTTTLTSGYTVEIENNGVVKNAFDYAGNLNLGQIVGGTLSSTPALNFNAGNGSAAFQSVISSSTGGVLTVNAPALVQFQVAGTNYAQFTTSGLNLLQTPAVVVGTASSSLTLKGNQAATGGPGVILDNAIAATSGKSISFRSNGSELLSVGWNGHIIQGSGLSTPTVGSFNSSFGTVSTFGVTGSDNAGIITFTTGTASLVSLGAALMVLTLAKTYSSTSFVAFATTASATGVLQGVPLYCVPTSANQITIYNGTSFTPTSSTSYSIQFHTMGAGATS